MIKFIGRLLLIPPYAVLVLLILIAEYIWKIIKAMKAP